MKNYFENAPVNWNRWNPNDIIFKSTNIVKKLLPSDNILSYSSKGDRDTKMCKKTGCKAISTSHYNGQPYTYYTKENYKGVLVHLKNVKDEYPVAHIDFIDWREEVDSVGNRISNLDLLMYVNSFHEPWEYVRCPQTGSYTRKQSGNSAPLDEGYRVSVGGQGDSNPMTFQTLNEVFQITEAIKLFLVDCVVPMKRGEFDYDHLYVT